MSYEEIKNANLAMLRRSLILNMIFFKDMPPWWDHSSWWDIVLHVINNIVFVYSTALYETNADHQRSTIIVFVTSSKANSIAIGASDIYVKEFLRVSKSV